MTINQNTIATKLNLSIATVSRALKNDKAINAKTRTKVLEMAKEAGYILPQQRAKMKREKERNLYPVCAFIQTDDIINAPDAKDYIIPQYITGMSAAASRLDTSLMTHCVPLEDQDNAAIPENFPMRLREGHVRGLILINRFPDHVIRQLSSQFKCVSIAYDYNIPGVSLIELNNQMASKILTEKLINAGHRNIAYIGGPPCERLHWPLARLAGFMEAISLAGLPFDHRNIIDINNLMPTLKERIRQGVTGLVCCSDRTGYEIMKLLKSEGFSIPEDISMTGFDAISCPEGLTKLCSVKQQNEKLGEAAVKLLLSDNNDEEYHHKVFLPPEVSEGDSIGNI